MSAAQKRKMKKTCIDSTWRDCCISILNINNNTNHVLFFITFAKSKGPRHDDVDVINLELGRKTPI